MMLYYRIKNWILEYIWWIIVIGGVTLLVVLAFQAGYVLGRHELSPIIIETGIKDYTKQQ